MGRWGRGCNQTSIGEMNYAIYPNPLSNSANISFSTYQKNTNIKLVDIMGKEIRTSIFSGVNFLFEKEDLPSGIYFLSITDSQQNNSIKKIVIDNN